MTKKQRAGDKPPMWQSFGLAGKAILGTLFIFGLWHLIRRLREYITHYTYKPDDINYSITREEKEPDQPFTRFAAYAFLLGGYVISVGVGLFIGWRAEGFFADLTLLFRHHATAVSGPLSPAALMISGLIIYPPISVLIIDTLHAIASRIDTG